MISPTVDDLNRRAYVRIRNGPILRRGEVKRLDESYVWMLYDDETELYLGMPALRATIRAILFWEQK